MTTSTTADAGQGPPGRRSARPGRRRLVIGITAALVGLVVVLGVDAATLTSRIDRFDALSLADAPGPTWVFVGLDSRADLPDGASVGTFGTPEEVPGSRADVVVVLQQTSDGMTVLSVPRDVVVRSAGRPTRLALTWLQGPQATVDALCSLGIPTGHLVSLDLAGFAAIVDAAGGLEVDIPEPVRDPGSGLLLPDAGRQRIDGTTAVALVRSRHPESLVDGEWTPEAVDPDGRATTAGTVLSALASAARSAAWRPWRLQSTAWAASGALTVDDGTSFPELGSLATEHLAPVQVLPVGPPVNGTVARFTVPETAQAVADAGMSCAG